MLNRQYLVNLTPEWARPIARRLGGRARRFGSRLRDHPRLSEVELRRILAEELAVKSGDVVFVHSSAGAMNLAFPFYRIIPILRETVGSEGTLLFPTTQHLGRAADWLRRDEVFDVKRSPTTMGVIAEFARRQRDAVRSLHPTNSVVAIGKHARELTQDHHRSIYPCDEFSPYYRVVHHEGRIVGLGVSCENLSFLHCVEDVWKDRFPVETREARAYDARVRDESGQEIVVTTLAAHSRIRWRNIPRYLHENVAPEAYRDMTVNGVTYFTVDARKLFRRMEELASQGITMYAKFVYKSCFVSRWF